MGLTKVRFQKSSLTLVVSLMVAVLGAGILGFAQTQVTPGVQMWPAGPVFVFDNETGGEITGIGIVFDSPIALEERDILALGGGAVTGLDVSGRSAWIDVALVPRGTLLVSLTGEDVDARITEAYWVTSPQEKYKAVLQRFVEEFWNKGDLAVADETMATDYVNHDPNAPGVQDLETYKQMAVVHLAGFPDFHLTTEEMTVEGDKVAARWTSRATHQGEYMGIPPTGNLVTVTGINIFRFAGSKVVECWWAYDALGMLQQLSVIPPMGREDFTWGASSEVTGVPGNPEESEALFRGHNEAWNQGKIALVDEFLATDFVNHDPTNPRVCDRESYKQWAAVNLSALPDFHVTCEDVVADGDLLACRWTARGTHQGALGGLPPTGKQLMWTGISIIRVADGKIVEIWWSRDTLGLLQQLGIIPTPE